MKTNLLEKKKIVHRIAFFLYLACKRRAGLEIGVRLFSALVMIETEAYFAL
jgi:hypothetical protein